MQQLSRKARKLIKKERKAAEKLEMKKALKHGVIGVIVFFSIIIFSVAASAIEVTYYAKSHHFQDLPYNEQHQFIGLEFRDNVSGYGIANYKNSYHENSLMVSYSRYWQPYRHIELNLSASAATGYDKLRRCGSLDSNSDICPIFSGGIAYTKYQYFKPRLSLFGGALTLSISGEL